LIVGSNQTIDLKCQTPYQLLAFRILASIQHCVKTVSIDTIYNYSWQSSTVLQ